MRRLAAGLAIAFAGCSEAPPPEPPSPPPAPSPAAEGWLGRWTGPEGLHLQIDPTEEGGYRLILKDDLDTENVYRAQVVSDGLRFVRSGREVVIRAGSGAETGFKWLADKQDCLILVPDQEGYCRD